jgi:hypothetical protein
MTQIQPVSFAAVCLVLSACGGSEGGGGVASTPASIPETAPAPSTSPTPPPVTLTSSTVVLTPLTNRAGLVAGTYQPIAIAYDRAKGSEAIDKLGAQTTRFIDSAAITLNADPSALRYTLEISLSGVPGQKVFDLSKTTDDNGEIVASNFGNHVVRTDTYSDGTRKVLEYDADGLMVYEPFKDVSPSAATRDSYGVNLGLRYVSFGSWYQEDIEHIGSQYRSGIFQGARSVNFVFGRRTTTGELPITGTANYRGKVSPFRVSELSGDWFDQFDLTLTARFSTKSIDALIAADAVSGDGWETGDVFGLSLSGTGAIMSDGGYAILLTGKTISPLQTVASDPLTGSLQGAFFGPGAEEAGGVFKIDRNAAPLLYGTYGLARTDP